MRTELGSSVCHTQGSQLEQHWFFLVADWTMPKQAYLHLQARTSYTWKTILNSLLTTLKAAKHVLSQGRRSLKWFCFQSWQEEGRREYLHDRHRSVRNGCPVYRAHHYSSCSKGTCLWDQAICKIQNVNNWTYDKGKVRFQDRYI